MARQDPDLMKAVACGDPDALGELYDRYAPVLLAVGWRILGSRKEAEDVLHDVFLEIWRKAADYDEKRGSVRAWLVLRLRSRALDHLRSAAYSRSVALDPNGLNDENGDESDVSTLATDCHAVRQAMASLSADQRRVLELAYFQGLSTSEIATQLGIPIGTVKSRIHGALKALRALFLGNHKGM